MTAPMVTIERATNAQATEWEFVNRRSLHPSVDLDDAHAPRKHLELTPLPESISYEIDSQFFRVKIQGHKPVVIFVRGIHDSADVLMSRVYQEAPGSFELLRAPHDESWHLIAPSGDYVAVSDTVDDEGGAFPGFSYAWWNGRGECDDAGYCETGDELIEMLDKWTCIMVEIKEEGR